MATILEEYIAKHSGSAQRYAEATQIFPGGVTHDNRYAQPFPLYILKSDDVVSFGTKADIVSGLDYLQQNQWKGIWPNIEDFKINMDSVHAGGDEQMAWGVATWTSTGFHEDGTSFFTSRSRYYHIGAA